MASIEITSAALRRFRDGMNNISERQAPYATRLALNYTAVDIHKAQRKEMVRVFDNPTNFTLNSLYIAYASRRKLVATVKFKDYIPKGTAASAYLQPQVVGGQRLAKRFEKQLRRSNILPSNMITVPGSGIRTTKAGNISRGQISKMMSNVRGSHDKLQHTTNNPRKYFIKKDEAGQPVAIYVRRGRRKALPFLVFVDSASYHKRYDFYGVAHRVRDKTIHHNFRKGWRKALSTAR